MQLDVYTVHCQNDQQRKEVRKRFLMLCDVVSRLFCGDVTAAMTTVTVDDNHPTAKIHQPVRPPIPPQTSASPRH